MIRSLLWLLFFLEGFHDDDDDDNDDGSGLGGDDHFCAKTPGNVECGDPNYQTIQFLTMRGHFLQFLGDHFGWMSICWYWDTYNMITIGVLFSVFEVFLDCFWSLSA